METISIQKPEIEKKEKTPPVTINVDVAMKKKIERYVRLCRRAKKIEDAKEKIKGDVVKFCEGRNTILNYGQEQLGTVNEREKVFIDAAGLYAAAPDIALKFTKRTPYLELRCA